MTSTEVRCSTTFRETCGNCNQTICTDIPVGYQDYLPLRLKYSTYAWTSQGHRVLIFSQTRQMLNFIELFVKNMGWSYGRLDGSTPVGTRQASPPHDTQQAISDWVALQNMNVRKRRTSGNPKLASKCLVFTCSACRHDVSKVFANTVMTDVQHRFCNAVWSPIVTCAH